MSLDYAEQIRYLARGYQFLGFEVIPEKNWPRFIYSAVKSMYSPGTINEVELEKRQFFASLMAKTPAKLEASLKRDYGREDATPESYIPLFAFLFAAKFTAGRIKSAYPSGIPAGVSIRKAMADGYLLFSNDIFRDSGLGCYCAENSLYSAHGRGPLNEILSTWIRKREFYVSNSNEDAEVALSAFSDEILPYLEW